MSCAVILHHPVVLIHDLSLQTHKAKSASTLEKYAYGERQSSGRISKAMKFR